MEGEIEMVTAREIELEFENSGDAKTPFPFQEKRRGRTIIRFEQNSQNDGAKLKANKTSLSTMRYSYEYWYQ